MEKVNILIRLMLIFAGITSFDIKAAAKQPRDEDVRPMQEGEDKSETPTTGTRRRREEEGKEQRPVKQKLESEEKKSEEKKEELSPERKAEIEEATTLLINSVFGDNIEQVKEAIAKGANVNVQDINGYTPLMMAALQGLPEIIELLLEKGAKINAQDNDGDTALIKALGSSSIEKVKLLLQKGADVLLKNKKGFTALTLASKDRKNYKMVKLLLEYGANVEIEKDFYTNRTRFQFMKKNYPHLQIAYQEFLRTVDKLFKLVEENNFKQLKEILIEFPHYVNLQDKSGSTALMKASEKGKTEIVKLLLENGAKINAQDINGDTALMQASRKGKTEIVKLLLENGAKINAQNINGDIALMHASQRGNVEIVKLLLEKGANVNYQNNVVFTALMLASIGGHTKIVELLLEYGADVNVKNKYYSGTALILASEYARAAVVKLLLEYNDNGVRADINAKDKDGNTPIIIAAQKGDIPTLKLLLEHGADPFIKNNENQSALDYIEKNTELHKIYKEFVNTKIKKHFAMSGFRPIPKSRLITSGSKTEVKSELLPIPEISKGPGPGEGPGKS